MKIMNRIFIIGHRGASNIAPENTLWMPYVHCHSVIETGLRQDNNTGSKVLWLLIAFR